MNEEMETELGLIPSPSPSPETETDTDSVDGELVEDGMESLADTDAPFETETPAVDTGVDTGIDYVALYDAVYDASYDALAAYSQSVTDGQTINNTALSYFQGILNNKFLPVDYVIYVGSPFYQGSSTYYEYCMAYGDLSLSGTRFSGTGTVVTMRVTGNNRTVNYAYNQQIDLNAPMYYSRSNLGEYSGAVTYDWSSLLILISLVLGGVAWFVKKLLRISF